MSFIAHAISPGLTVVGGDFEPPFFETVVLSSFTDTITKTTRADGKKVKQNRIGVVITSLTYTGTITGGKVQFTADGGATWKTAAADYSRAYFDQDGQVLPGTADGIPVLINTVPAFVSFEIHGMGLLVPTMVRAADMTVSTSHVNQIAGMSRAAETHDGFRIILTGTSVDITGGTMYVGYFD